MQEKWHNLDHNTTVKYPAYHLVSPGGSKSRTCVYNSKQLAVENWNVKIAPENAGGDITSISLQTSQGKVWVHSIYNPPPRSHSSKDLGTLQWIPQILTQAGHHILLGDFNLHHPR